MTHPPHLHETLRQKFEIALPLESVVQHLLESRQPGVNITLLEQSSDYATLSVDAVAEGEPSYTMDVRLQRWQGTDTHVQLYGEVVTAETNKHMMQAIVAGLTLFAGSSALWVMFNVLPPPLGNMNAIVFCFGSLGLLAAVMGIAIGSYSALVRDWHGKRRWRDQQSLAGFARNVEAQLKESAATQSLTTEHGEDNDLVLTDEDEMHHSR